MPRASCIAYPPDEMKIVIHNSLLELCKGDHCHAAVLRQMIYWTDIKLASAEQAVIHNRVAEQTGLDERWPTDNWVYKSAKELAQELMGLYGERKVAESLKFLVAIGLLNVRRNPINTWDRTLQYDLQIGQVRRRLFDLSMLSKRSIGTAEKLDQGGENAEAIPETTTDTTSETGTGSDATPPSYGAAPGVNTIQSGNTEAEQARLSPQTPSPTPPPVVEITNGWKVEELDRLKQLVTKTYPLAGPGEYQPSKAALNLLSSLPRDRANDFVKAVRNYARKAEGQESKWTRSLGRFLEDGFWEQFIKTQSKAGKPAAQATSAGRDINAEADAVPHSVKMQSTYVPAFDKSRQEAS